MSFDYCMVVTFDALNEVGTSKSLGVRPQGHKWFGLMCCDKMLPFNYFTYSEIMVSWKSGFCCLLQSLLNILTSPPLMLLEFLCDDVIQNVAVSQWNSMENYHSGDSYHKFGTSAQWVTGGRNTGLSSSHPFDFLQVWMKQAMLRWIYVCLLQTLLRGPWWIPGSAHDICNTVNMLCFPLSLSFCRC